MSTWEPCGYGCGKPWRRWAGTTLIGHARCAATPEHKSAILDRMEATPGLTQRMVATENNVSVSTIRAWLDDALKDRRKARQG